MIEIYDDVFDCNIQDHIEEYILNSKKKEPSWYFEKSTCAVGYKNHHCVEESPQIVRGFRRNGVDVEPFNYAPFERFLNGKYFYRCKSNILFQKKFRWFEDKRKVNMPHVDLYYPHTVILYYVNDSDGDTVIYKERYTGTGKPQFPQTLTELKRIEPKRGRVVVFDGLHYHSSSNPRKNSYRCVINFDIV